MDPAWLEQADQHVESQCPTRKTLLVVRNGYLVHERYFHGATQLEARNVKGIANGIVSLLTGIAMEDGLLKSTEQRIVDWYPEYLHAGSDTRKLDIDIRHLLTMRSGLESTAGALTRNSDWHRTILDAPLAAEPGETFRFGGESAHLLTGILTKASRTTLLAYSHARLFLPLGARCDQWDKDPRGYYIGGSDMYFMARDVAKFGLLILRNGKWGERQLVPQSWIAAATGIQRRTSDPAGHFGYLWWVRDVQGYRTIYAVGTGGQALFVVPEFDLVVLTTAASADDSEVVAQQAVNLLADFVIPAVNQEKPELATDGIVNSLDYTPRLAPGSAATALGSNFSLTSSTTMDEVLPQGLGGVRIRVGGQWAAISSVSPTQVAFIVPNGVTPGTYTVEVMNPRGIASQDVVIAEYAPAWYVYGRDGKAYVTPQSVKAGQQVELRAGGLGATVATLPVVEVSGRAVPILSTALASAGIYRILVVIPQDLAAGEHGISLSIGGVPAASLALLSVTD